MSRTISRRPTAERAPVANVFGPLASVVNPLAVLLAGRKGIPIWAIVRHRGRRTGRVRATPVAVGWKSDALYIPLPFSARADWCRNVLAAGGCTVRWNGAEHEMADPAVVGEADAVGAFNSVERALLRILGIRAFLRLRFLRWTSEASSQTLHEAASL